MISCLVEEAAAEVTLTQLARKRKTAKQTALPKKQATPAVLAASPASIVATLVPSVYVGDGQAGDFVWEINATISSGAHAAINTEPHTLGS